MASDGAPDRARNKDIGPGGLVIVDKPSGFTSHDVVAKLRGMARTRRVGHAGTLDPMATGVLVIGVGRATRLLGHLALTEKEYVATVRLGQSTVTEDAEGEITAARGAWYRPRVASTPSWQRLTGEIHRCRRRSAPSRWTAGAPISGCGRARRSSSPHGRSPSRRSPCTRCARSRPRTAHPSPTCWSRSSAPRVRTYGRWPGIWVPDSARAGI